MRSSRLLALLLALQRHGLTTAPELAVELEVSVRTIYRDVAALQQAGVPVWTAAGPGGGIRLVEGWRSPVEGMTGDEAGALLLGPAGAADLGMASILATARSKVRSGLPAALRTQIDVIGERFLLDVSAWGRHREPATALAEVAAAVWAARRVDVVYRAGSGDRRRRLDPLGLVLKAGTWYLVAAHRRRVRTYRVQRIVSVRTLDTAASRPDGFDLARYWQDAALDFDRSIRRMPTVLRVPRTSLGQLRRAVPGPVTEAAVDAADALPDGLCRVALPLENEAVALTQLTSVAGAEVVSPASLRRALCDHARDLAERNAPPQP